MMDKKLVDKILTKEQKFKIYKILEKKVDFLERKKLEYAMNLPVYKIRK